MSDEDYRFYLQNLQELSVKHGCQIHAYVLMTNHVHLLLTPLEAKSISQLMQSMGRRYVQHFNHQYGRTGTLWEGRYKATLLDSDRYLLTCYRYIELNPVRAGMVKHPADYPWSSYRSNALGDLNPVLTPHMLYEALGSNDKERQVRYQMLYQNPLDDKYLQEIREATNKAWVLGNDRFRQRIEEMTNRQVQPKRRGGDRKSEVYKKSR